MKFIILLTIIFISLNVVLSFPTNAENRQKYCKSCNAFVSFAVKLSQNNSDSRVENQLIAICNDYSSLPGQQTTIMCTHIVRDIIKMLKNVNTTTFCDEISACDNEYLNRNSITKESTVTDNETCQFCIQVITNVKDIISGSQTEIEVKGIVEDWCHYLGSFENECVSLLDEYLDQLFQYIRTSLQPNQVCSSLGACPKQANRLPSVPKPEKIAEITDIINIYPAQLPLTQLRPAEQIKASDDVECLLCKKLVQIIVDELKDNRTEASIEAALDHVCQLVPSSERNQCLSFVNTYTDELIHILTEETDPNMACTLIGLCVPPSLKKDLEIESHEWNKIEPSNMINSIDDTSNNNKLCFECELILHFLQTEMYDYNNEEQIENFIENFLCDKLKVVVLKETCDSFVKQYGPAIMQLIAQKYFDPTTVCKTELRLCPNNSYALENEEQFDNDIVLTRASEKCDLCVSLVQQIDGLLENDAFDKEIAQIVERACFSLPKQKQQECESMVEAFAPYFLQMIGHLSNAQQICKSIDMCYTSGHTQLLGGHKCTFGPSYWCHTIAHADACKATNYCRTKIWKAMP
jgi:saposin